jgi:hypothetical protein
VDPSDDIPDDEGLLRRIPPWHSPQESQNPGGGGPPTLRPPSPAFNLEKDEEGLSFHIESSLRAAGEPLTYGCPFGEPGWAVARITAAEVRSLGLRIERDKLPHHVQAFGFAELMGTAKRRMARNLAKIAIYVIPPRVL